MACVLGGMELPGMLCGAAGIPMPIIFKSIRIRKSRLATFAHKCLEVSEFLKFS